MTGTLFVALAIGWLIAALAATRWATRRFNSRAMKVATGLVLFPALLVAPLADELIGKQQFEQLCKDNSTIQVDRATAVGKTVYLAIAPDVEIKDKWVRIVLKPWRFVDATTSEPVVSYNSLMADGGWLIRHLGISEGRVPLTFGGSCEPGGAIDPLKLFEDLGVTQIQRSALTSRNKK